MTILRKPGRRVAQVGLFTFVVGLCFALCDAAQTPGSSQQRADAAYQAGMRLLQAKRYSEAWKQFQLVQRCAPRLPLGFSGEGIALALMGKPDEAIRSLKKALEIDPGFWVARRELGIVYWHQSLKEQASKELYPILELFPGDPAVNLLLGQYEFEHQNYSKAVAFFAKASALVEANPGVSLMEGQALIKTGQVSKAGDRLEGLVNQPGLTAQQKFELAWLLGQTKRYKLAIQVFGSLPADYPDRFSRGYGLALAYFEDQQYPKCIETLSALKSEGVTRPELYSLLGVAYEKSGRTLEAYDTFRQGIYANPKDARNYLNLATLSVQHLNYDVAAQVLYSGIEQIPGDFRLYLTRGVLSTLRGQLVNAQADYEHAFTLAPNESSVHLALGLCYVDQNRFDDAIKTFQRALRRQMKDVLLYYFLADALLRKGVTLGSPPYDQTLEAVESCLAIDPTFAYAYLDRARLELMASRLDKAIADLERARALEPDSRAVLYQLGIAYRRAGMKAEAEKLLAIVEESSKEESGKSRRDRLTDTVVGLSEVSHLPR